MFQSVSEVQFFAEWKAKDLSEATIQSELVAKGYDSLQISEILLLYKKALLDERQNLGFVLTGIGAIMCLLSCTLTLLNIFPNYFEIVLYGLTFLGVIVTVVGLYFIFED